MPRRGIWTKNVPSAVVGMTVVVMVTVGIGSGVWMVSPAPPPPDPYRPTLAQGTYPTAPLAPGESVPPVEADGWVNGPPRQPFAARLTVLDIWSSW